MLSNHSWKRKGKTLEMGKNITHCKLKSAQRRQQLLNGMAVVICTSPGCLKIDEVQ